MVAYNKGIATSTNGIAAHDTFDKAREAATCELLVRDAVVVSWLLKRAPQWLGSEQFSPLVCENLKAFYDHNLEVQLGVLAQLNGRYCCVGAIRPGSHCRLNFGVTLSASCSKSKEAALLGVIKDLRRACAVILGRMHKGRPCFLSDSEKSPFFGKAQMHFEHYLDPQNINQIEWFLSESGPPYMEDGLAIRSAELEIKYTPPWSFAVVRCSSDELQDFYLGPYQTEKLNPQRLEQIGGPNIKLNRHLHYLP